MKPIVTLAAVVASLLLVAVGEHRFPEAPASDPVATALADRKPAVVEFGANACAACRDMKVVLADLRRTRGGDLSIVEIDLIEHRDYAARFGVRLMPTQIFFDADGREVGRNEGRIDAGGILARLGMTH